MPKMFVYKLHSLSASDFIFVIYYIVICKNEDENDDDDDENEDENEDYEVKWENKNTQGSY